MEVVMKKLLFQV